MAEAPGARAPGLQRPVAGRQALAVDAEMDRVVSLAAARPLPLKPGVEQA